MSLFMKSVFVSLLCLFVVPGSRAATVTFYDAWLPNLNRVQISGGPFATSVLIWGDDTQTIIDIDGIKYDHDWTNGLPLRIDVTLTGGGHMQCFYLSVTDVPAADQPRFYYIGDSGVDEVLTGKKEDEIYTWGGSDIISSYDGIDNINSGSNNDRIYSGIGVDHITDGHGTDTLDQGGAADSITGTIETITNPTP